ncbi:hypothetical protein MOTE_25270 [Moorella thermoacetica]|uniref:Uncharacterized protein n=1 Tax=Neomoorella thermoacetica TaxID=1525 RepID=A0A1J5N323_NEOTH|nr:hypothetical protein MOTE_25270 [Moorella thermoacetica]
MRSVRDVLRGGLSDRGDPLRIPDEIREALGPRRDPVKEIMKRLAVSLYAERKISLGKAVELSGTSYSSFLEALADFGVDLDYDEEDLMSDLEVLERLRSGVIFLPTGADFGHKRRKATHQAM